MTDNYGRPHFERRMSLTERVLTNSRGWLNIDQQSKVASTKNIINVEQPTSTNATNNQSSNTNDKSKPARQRSKSLSYSEYRDIILPGPAF